MKEITSMYTLRITQIKKVKEVELAGIMNTVHECKHDETLKSYLKEALNVDDVRVMGRKVFERDLKRSKTMKEVTIETIVKVGDSIKVADEDVAAIITAEKDIDWQRAKAKDIAEKLNVDDVIFMPEVKHFIYDCKEESKRGKSRKKKSGAA